ncbi:MAG: selenocysteine-specific translation elongation factor [Planctomycetota bacterium]
MKSDDILRVVIGTAGHIDHDKSSLVLRLTGRDPDRLREEKERGMTIDLGFAPWTMPGGRRVGMVDVPGHERFIKNMVAGATGVDCVLLVIAADDGVMPQTREHLEILELLGIDRGLIALTKIDVVEPDLRELAESDVRELVSKTFLKDAPIVPVSSVTGDGLENLVDELEKLVESVSSKEIGEIFRLPIQRVFSSQGHGTVMTGVPMSGSAEPGDILEVLPGGVKGKVRGLQAYLESVERVRAGHSSAINLTEVDYKDVRRGQVLATPGAFCTAQRIEARLQYLGSNPKPLRDRDPVRFHVGTVEVVGEVVLLESPRVEPGDSTYVEIRLKEPCVVGQGDRFILRRASPLVTLGGGVVLGTTDKPLKRRKVWVLDRLERREAALGDPRATTFEVLRGYREPVTFDELRANAHRTKAALEEDLQAFIAAGDALALTGNRYIHGEVAERGRQRLLDLLDRLHKKEPLKPAHDKAGLMTASGLERALFEAVLEDLHHQGKVAIERGGWIRRADFQVQLDGAQAELLEKLEARYAEGGFAPPSRAEIAKEIQAKDIARLLDLLEKEGKLCRVGGEVVLHKDIVERAKQILVKQAQAEGGQVDIPKLRDALQTTRKYLIPLLEYFDRQGITRRIGDRRVLR